MADLDGTTLGAYRIVERIGRGGMATVYRAYHAAMNREVAIKVLPEEHATDPDFRTRFEREAQTVANLRHPYILPVFDYGEDRNISYLVMPYIPTGTLKKYLIDSSPLPFDTIISIITHLGEALDYAHRQGVIHRDVKPDNVLFDEESNPLLTDFGLTRMMEGGASLTGTGVIGTPAYMSPEQGQGKRLDHRSDIYSLGVILYEMVTGQVPFSADTPVAVIFKHVSDPLPMPKSKRPDLPDNAQQVLLKALAKDPEDRWESCGAMVSAFSEAINNPQTSGDVRPTTSLTDDEDGIRTVTGLQGDTKPVPDTPTSYIPSPADSPPEPPDNIGNKEGKRPPVPILIGIIVLLAIVGGILAVLNQSAGEGEATLTPEQAQLERTAAALLLTQTAAPPVTPSPDATQRIQALMAEIIQTETANAEATSAGYTNTPEPSHTPSDTPTPTTTHTATSTPTTTFTATQDTQATVQAQATNDAQQTQVALMTTNDAATQIAQLTANAPTNTPRPTNTPSATPTPTVTDTATPIPTDTATATPTTTPSPTITPSPTDDATATTIALQTQIFAQAISTESARATVTAEAQSEVMTMTPVPAREPSAQVIGAANVRSGPGTQYDVVFGLYEGDQVIIENISDDGEWYQIRTNEGANGWVAFFLVDVTRSTVLISESDVDEAIARAYTFNGTHNRDWQPVERDFDGVTMVLVPAGCFMMGSDDGEEDDFAEDESPAHEQCFDEPFWIDKYEVTNQQFTDFNGIANNENTWESEFQPRTDVSNYEARDFCALRGGSLPTEAQWEYAARGVESWRYPWGNENSGNIVVHRTNSNLRPAEVGIYPEGASWVGAVNMAGNVYEETSSLEAPYPYDGNDGREDVDRSRYNLVIVRGGGYTTPNSSMSNVLTSRFGGNANASNKFNGFRCMRPIDQDERIELPEPIATSTPESLADTDDPIALAYAFEGTQNSDWTPVERDFDGVTMVLVPAGCFMMGSDSGLLNEAPVHEQCFDEPFWIDKYEVTNEQFEAFGVQTSFTSVHQGSNRPKDRVTWLEAWEFCFLRNASLPTEAQWEYAARGVESWLYPWGNNWTNDNNIRGQIDRDGTVDVGSLPEAYSWVGAYDMSGNVWEWTNSLYRPYPFDATDGREAYSDGEDDRRITRGNSWGTDFANTRTSSFRSPRLAIGVDGVTGFRCARPVD
jgi:formylglycine-generating enzyme required for sulfatase activity/serine/threonine protein kinase